MVLDVNDIERERKRLESAGVKFEGKTEEIPGIVRIATFRDPDGNRLQLAQALMEVGNFGGHAMRRAAPVRYAVVNWRGSIFSIEVMRWLYMQYGK